MELLEKTSTEVVPVEFEFAPILPEGEILDNGSSALLVYDGDGVNVSTSLCNNTCDVLENTRIRGKLSNGTHGEDYKVKFKGVTDPSGYIMEGYLLLQIRDKNL